MCPSKCLLEETMSHPRTRRFTITALALITALFSFGAVRQAAHAEDQPAGKHFFKKMMAPAAQTDVQVGRMVRIALEPAQNGVAHSVLLLPTADQIKNRAGAHHHMAKMLHKFMKNPAEHGGLQGTINGIDVPNLTLNISGLQVKVAKDAKVIIQGEGAKDLSALTNGMRVRGFGKV